MSVFPGESSPGEALDLAGCRDVDVVVGHDLYTVLVITHEFSPVPLRLTAKAARELADRLQKCADMSPLDAGALDG
jgi:hypothetical protein